jgi:hypothetical protein
MMSTPRKVRAIKKIVTVMKELFEAFPDLLWFRNVHDGLVHFDRVAEYIAHWSIPNGSFHMEYLIKELNGPVLYYGRDLEGRLWMFASNTLANPNPNQNWLISVEKPDHFMVAVFNTILNRNELLPFDKGKLFHSSMGLSNCEEPDRKVVEWLQKHEADMPEALAEACDRAQLYRM